MTPLVTTLSGPLDADGAAAIEAVARTLHDSPETPPLVFQMADVSRIDSDGLRAFLHCLRRLTARRPAPPPPVMTFRACPPAIAAFLRLAGFHRACLIEIRGIRQTKETPR